MKTVKHAVPALLFVLLLPAAAHVQAQAAALSDCQAIQDRLARYACYDSWDAASGGVRPAAPRAAQPQAPRAESTAPQAAPGSVASQPATSPAPAASAASPESNAVADFGRPQSGARVIDGEDGAELVGTVASLEQLGPNLWIVTLEGGQQWRQMLTKRYTLQVGDQVRIYSTRWGSSYRLSSERLGGYIQVERIDAGAVTGGAMPAPRSEAEPAAVEARDDEPSLLSRIFRRDGDDTEAGIAQPGAAAGSAAPASADNFGRQQARVVQDEDGNGTLVDTVADLEQLGPNLWLITLEGGQRWQQMLSKRYGLQVGDEVKIYSTRWGSSFRLSVDRLGGYIQVERID